MLLMLTGSSGSGKSTIARSLAGRSVPGIVVHDFDELLEPGRRGQPWRHQSNEVWVRRAIDYERQGLDLLLTGQSPLGEVLATPSAPELQGIATCLVDVADGERLARLRLRRPPPLPELETALLRWAHWHRRHAADPRYRPEVITGAEDTGMRWDRWAGWSAGDRRWTTALVDTTDRTVDDTAAEVLAWVEQSRAALAAGVLPLARGWDA